MLRSLPRPPRGSRVLVGPETWDDAGVLKIGPRLALVQTVDFITPVVNDPYDYGRIAAANALSDVYAMGGTPLSALSIVCFPEKEDPALLREMLRGGAAMLRQAKVSLLGGHTVRDPEIKFGFAITGTVDPRRVVTNARIATRANAVEWSPERPRHASSDASKISRLAGIATDATARAAASRRPPRGSSRSQATASSSTAPASQAR